MTIVMADLTNKVYVMRMVVIKFADQDTESSDEPAMPSLCDRQSFQQGPGAKPFD